MAEKNLKAYHPRKHQRRLEQVRMVICVKGVCGTAMTKDRSDGGIAINLLTATDLPELKVGSIVSTREEDSPHTTSMVGKVVRMDAIELAIEFVC